MIVLDTNVVSELMRAAPAATVVSWVGGNSTELVTTAITLAEISYGIQRLPDGRRKDLLAAAADEVFTAFADQILPFDAPAAAEYAVIVGGRERAGIPIDGFDGQIAAICRARSASLATRNVKNFTATGIEVLNPWRG